MHFSVLDNVYWVGGFLSGVALLAVLLWRGRWRVFPVFTLWFAYVNLHTLVLFCAYLLNSRRWYAHVYYFGLWFDFALQLGVAIEIARIVLRPTGTWVQDARARFLAAGLAGAAVAAVVACWVSPPAYNMLYRWLIRGDLFTSLVICELYVAMSLTASRLGLGWRSHVMAIGQGLTAWTAVMVLTTALQSYLGTGRSYEPLDHVRGTAYFLATLWMAIRLWYPEPERQPIAPELHDHILALRRRVEYDLRRLDAGR